MNQSRLFIPNMNVNPLAMRNTYMMPRNPNIFRKLANSINTFNWAKLINGASKTLNFMNQTIPLVKQTKPMINNMKSIIQLTRVFKKETTTNNNLKSQKKEIIKTSSNKIINNNPTFFI